MRLTSFGRSGLGPIATSRRCSLRRALRVLWLTGFDVSVPFGLWWGFFRPARGGLSVHVDILPRGVVIGGGRFLLVWWPE